MSCKKDVHYWLKFYQVKKELGKTVEGISKDFYLALIVGKSFLHSKGRKIPGLSKRFIFNWTYFNS